MRFGRNVMSLYRSLYEIIQVVTSVSQEGSGTFI